jgi:hypothetical protein
MMREKTEKIDFWTIPKLVVGKLPQVEAIIMAGYNITSITQP